MKFWTTITPMGRVGKPDELNGLAVFLSSDAARFVTGSNVFCDVSSFGYRDCIPLLTGGVRVVIMFTR